ncbi:N-acetylneuraminate synthase family protein [Candidatus Pelagibacter sp.]|uniref:N-acetylneuraminate synthase family protein n=1 Tax=Candidatus Pelagibacter sp. TaxID=2024849 RepID=UPI003F868F4C
MGKNLKHVEFIAEIASSHNGSLKILKKLVEKLMLSNLDTIKFQIFNLKKLAHPTYKFYNILKKISISNLEYEKIIKKVLKKKKVILEPFDYESLEFCKKFKNKVSIKISASDNENIRLIKTALENFNRVFISVSGYNISKVREIYKKFNKSNKIIFTYGFQSFPTDYKNLRLDFIKQIKKNHMKVCYADHTSRNNIFKNISIIKQAIDNGAQFIEKHVILDKNKEYVDKVSSLDVLELNDLKNFFIRRIKNKKTISYNEKKYSKIMTRNGVFLYKLNKGHILSKKDVIFLRTGQKGISENQINMYYKKKLKNNVKKGQIIEKKFFY